MIHRSDELGYGVIIAGGSPDVPVFYRRGWELWVPHRGMASSSEQEPTRLTSIGGHVQVHRGRESASPLEPLTKIGYKTYPV